MSQNNSTQNNNIDFDSTNLIAFLFKWRKTFLLIGIASIVLSSIASYMITPKYKSTVVMFPAQTSSIAKALISENNSGKEDILKFGEEEDAEQMLQMLNSDDIRGEICKKFDLLKHYDIDEDDKFKYTNLFKEYESNIKFDRTELMSVEITVMDKDPKMAANIANEISNLLDSMKTKIQRDRALEGLKIVAKSYWNLKAEIKAIQDSLGVLRDLGVNDYETQASVFNEQYAIALAKGNKSGVKELEEKLKILAKHGGAYITLSQNHEEQIKQLTEVKRKYEEAKIDAEQNLPSKFIVNKAFEAEKKSYPIRWIIVAVSFVSTMLFALILLIILENFKKVKPQA